MPVVNTPIEFTPDLGRRLTPEEIEALAPDITPLENIKCRTCKRVAENGRYPVKRR